MILDELSPELAEQVASALDAREPALLARLRADDRLNLSELHRVDAAIVVHSKAALGDSGEVTPISEVLRSAVESLRALIPECETEPAMWGRWLVDSDIPADPWWVGRTPLSGAEPKNRRPPAPPDPVLSPSSECDRLVPSLKAALYEVLAEVDPEMFGIIERRGGLNPPQIKRIGAALTGAHVGAMTPDWRPTVRSEFLRTLVWAFDRLVPPRSREIPGWGTT